MFGVSRLVRLQVVLLRRQKAAEASSPAKSSKLAFPPVPSPAEVATAQALRPEKAAAPSPRLETQPAAKQPGVASRLGAQSSTRPAGAAQPPVPSRTEVRFQPNLCLIGSGFIASVRN